MDTTQKEILEKLKKNDEQGMFENSISYTDDNLNVEVSFHLCETLKGCYWRTFDDGSGSLRRLADNSEILSYDFTSGEYKDRTGWRLLERDECSLYFLEKLVSKKRVYPIDGGPLPETRTFKKQRLFVDMDGTLAVFTPVDTMETLYEQGYFSGLEPHMNVINGVKEYMELHPDTEVFILSSVLSDSQYALKEKNEWLDKYIPEIDSAHRLFPPCGGNKTEYIPDGLKESDVLLDDYSVNLHEWEPPAKGIKVMNGINGTKGSWQGEKIEFDMSSHGFAEKLACITEGREYVPDPLEMYTHKDEAVADELFSQQPLTFDNLTYEDKFDIAIETEFPEIADNNELKNELYHHFMDSQEPGFFSDELREEFGSIIAEHYKEQDALFDLLDEKIKSLPIKESENNENKELER